MSERPPAGGEGQAAQAPTTPASAVPTADELIARQLQRRGAPQPPRTLAASIVARVAETAPERRWRLTLAVWRPRLAVAASGMTLALVAGLLFLGGPATRTSTTQGSPTPSVSPSQGVSGLTWDPAQRALTPPEFVRILATRPAPGTVLIVDDQIAPKTPCVSADGCKIGELVNSPGQLVQAPSGGHLPFANDQGTSPTSIEGPLALQVGAGPTLVFLGSVVSGGARLSFIRAPDLAVRNAMGGLFVVQAWLWETGPTPCASGSGTPVAMPPSELGLPAPTIDTCSPTDWLTDTEAIDPTRNSGIELPVQAGAYGAFGVDRSGPSQANPRQGIYLVRDWAGYGEILARLSPMPIPSNDAIAPTGPARAGGVVMSVDELVGRVLSSSLAAGSIAIANIPADAVSDRRAPGVVHSCPQLCPMWLLRAGARWIAVDVSMQAPAPSTIVGVQAFLVEKGGSVRALGPAATGAALAPLDGLAVRDGLSVVHGWLRIGPPLPCPRPPAATGAPARAGTLGGPLAWSQCPGTWILPSATDPWAGPPNNVQATDGSGVIRTGDSSVPAGTLHVQEGDLAALTPKEGDWLVRLAASSSPCPPGSLCPLIPPWEPPAGARWFELLGPIARPDATAFGPSASPSPVVLRQDGLVAGVTSGAFATGSIVVARATIAPVILSSFPPDPGAIVGKIGRITVHWGSDPGFAVPDPGPIALRVRADGGLDYLGPAILKPGDQPFASSDRPIVQGLALVDGWLYRPTVNLRCPEPAASATTPAFKAFDGQVQDLACDPAWILPSADDPLKTVGGRQILDIPNGGIPVQIRDAGLGAPTEGFYLIRYIPCLWTAALDGCQAPPRWAWELVGRVVVPGT